jgi:hypothetical protein
MEYGGPVYKREKKIKFLLHQGALEKVFLNGVRSRTKAANNKNQYTTGGLIPSVPSANRKDYKNDSATKYLNQTWLAMGEDWLDTQLEILSRVKGGNSTNRKLGFCGSLAMKALNDLAKASGDINITPQTNEYGMKVRRWVTNMGIDVDFFIHPFFNQRPSLRKTGLIFEIENLVYRYFAGNGHNWDTKFYKDPNLKVGGHYHLDAIKEAWKTQAGLEYHYPDTSMLLTNLGETNTYS